MIQGIYKIENRQNGKIYIGSSKNIEKRWKRHRWMLCKGCHANTHLQCAWNLYGKDAFIFSVLEEVEDDMLLVTEQEYLDIYLVQGHCYNIAKDVVGHTHTDETRRKIGNAHRGRKPSDETRRKMSDAAIGRVMPIKTRHKISKAMVGNQNTLGYKHTSETRRKMSNAKKGCVASTKTRHKISNALMGHIVSNETRRKLSNRVVSDKTRHKISKAREKPYPSFVHRETGATIPAGVNLRALCREYGLDSGNMNRVARGHTSHHRGWMRVDAGQTKL